MSSCSLGKLVKTEAAVRRRRKAASFDSPGGWSRRGNKFRIVAAAPSPVWPAGARVWQTRDGFLAPYKVVKVHIGVDIEGYRPEPGKLDREGVEVEDRLYNQKDFDRSLVIDARTALVAKKVSDFLKESGDRFQKTIVFCVDEEHAARMRQALVNENKDLCGQSHRYVMRITGSDAETSCKTPSTTARRKIRFEFRLTVEMAPVLRTLELLRSSGLGKVLS